MNATVQGLLVVVVVAAAASYAALKLMPAVWRQALAARVATLAARSGLSDADARRVEAKLASGGACGSCDSCKACATTPPGAADGGEPAGAGPHRIPIRRASS